MPMDQPMALERRPSSLDKRTTCIASVDGRTVARMGRMDAFRLARRPLVLAVIALFLAAAVPSTSHAITRGAAETKALKELGTNSGKNPVIVFGATSTIPAGAVVTEAGDDKAHSGGKTGMRTIDAPAVIRNGDEPAYLFHEDQGPYRAFEHPGRIVLVGKESGEVRVSRTLSWIPVVDGEVLPWFATAGSYEKDEFRVFERGVGAIGRSLRRSARAMARKAQANATQLESRRRTANALAAEKSCALRVSDTLGNFFDYAGVDRSRARLGSLLEQMERLNAGFRSQRYSASSGRTPTAELERMISRSGCKDVLLYLAGSGYSSGAPAVNVGTAPRGSDLRLQDVSATAIEGVMAAHRDVTFKVVIDAPYAGRIAERLRDESNMAVILTAGSAGEASYAYTPNIVAGGQVVRNTVNPTQLLEFTNRLVRGMEAFVDSPLEVDYALGQIAGGRVPSMMVWMLARGLQLGTVGAPALPTPPVVILGGRFQTPSGPPFTPPGPPPVVPPGLTKKNVAPVANDSTVPVIEDTPTSVPLPASDADGDSLSFAITEDPEDGSLSGSGNARTYTPAEDFTGTDSFTYKVTDPSGASDTAVVTLNVSAIDDDALVTTSPGTLAVTENDAAAVIDDEVDITDIDTETLNEATVAITGGFAGVQDVLSFADTSAISGDYDDATGVLTLTGSASVAAYQAALRTVEYRNTSDAPSVAARTITFAAAGGSDTRGIALTEVNDAPVNTVPTETQLVEEDTLEVFAPDNDNALTVSDVDARSGTVEVSLDVDHGTLSLDDTPGVTFTDADGDSATTMTGTVAAINAALDGAGYTPSNNYIGDDTLTIVTDDLGNTGGGDLVDTDTVDITVGPVNDAPVNTVPNGQTLAEDGTTAISPTVADSDALATDDLRVSLKVSNGTLTLGDASKADFTGTGAKGDGTDDAEMVFIGTKSELNAALAGLTYAPTKDFNGSDTLTMVTNDLGATGTGGAQSDSDPVVFTVTAVNDKPVNTLPGVETMDMDEDTTLSISPTVDDVDALSTDDLRVSLAVYDGTLTLGDASKADFTGTDARGDGTADYRMVFTGTKTELNAALAGLTYTPETDFDGSEILTMVTSDLGANGSGGTQGDSDLRMFDIAPVNDSPVNTVPGAQTLNEDAITSFSAANSTALSLVDVDAGSSTVTATLTVLHGGLSANTPTSGSRSGNGTTTLVLSGTVAAVNTALDTLSYGPDAHYNGADTLKIVTDDGGNNGSGGAKSDTDTVGLTITSVNDAPVNSVPAGKTINEDSTLTFSSAGSGAPSVSDADAGGDDVKVTFGALHGTLTLATQSGLTTVTGDGTGSVSATGSVSEVNAALDGLRYAPTANYNGADTLTMTTSDLGHNGPTVATDTDTIGVTIDAVNDAPVAVADTASTSEDTALSRNAAAGVLANDTDVEGSTLTAVLVTGPSNASSFTLNADGSFDYTPSTDSNGSDSFTYKANDGTADSNTVTVTLTVNAVNDAPVNSVPGTQTMNEDSNLVLSAGDAPSIADVDAGSSTMKLTLTASHGTLTLGGTSGLTVTDNGTATITASGSRSALNTALDGLKYSSAGNYNGADSISVKSEDNGNTGTGGNKSDTDAIAVTIDAVNDAPVAVADAFSPTEDTALSKNAAAGVLSNDSDVEGSALNAVLVTGPSNASSFTLNADGSFDYTPAGNFNGSDSFTYKANDGTADSNTVTVSLTVGAVNDAPVNSVPGTQTMNEDSNLVLSAGDAPSIADVDAGSSTMKLTLTVSHGTLTLSGTSGLTVTGNGTATITASGTRSALNTALDGLKYSPAGNYNGADSISVKSEDNGNTGTGGNKTDTDAIAMNVVAQNDGPVNSVRTTASTNEDTALTFSTANGNRLSFDDTDSGTDALTITVATTNGTSTLSGTTGLTNVTGNGTSSISATGTESALNTALNGLVFTPTSNLFGSAGVKLTTSDNGHNGAGGTLTDEDSVAITVASVNDAPIAFSPETQSTSEDTQLVFSPVPSVTDVDAAGDDVEVALSVGHGTLTLALTTGLTFQDSTTNDSASMKFRGTVAAVNSALNGLKYTPTADYSGPAAFTIAVSDLGHNGSGGTLTSSDATAITVGAANDAPIVDLNGNSAGTGTNPTFLETLSGDNRVVLAPNATVSDVDDANIENATVTLTNRPDGNAESLAATGTTDVVVDAYEASTGVLYLHGSAPRSEYEQVLRTVSYGNSASPPTPTDRTITFVVNDGAADSASATSTVEVVPLNTAPVVDLDTTDAASSDSEATFTEDSPAVNIAPNPDITDADTSDTHMESASITLTNRPDGANESLSTDGAGTAGITIDAYDSSTGVLLLHGHGTIADYETLISRVKYANASENPDTADRDITVTVSDGQASSTTRHAIVNVNRHNDQIANTVPGGQTFNEDTTRTFSSGNTNAISIADADAGAGAVKVTLSAGKGSFTSTEPSGGTRTGNNTGSLELTGTVSAVNASLDGISYTPNANAVGSDTITVASDDQGNSGGAATTDSDTIAITLTSVNDAPQNTVPGSQSVNEDTALPFSSGNGNQISTGDVDAGTDPVKVTLAVGHGTLTMSTLTGLTFTSGDGTNDATMTFTGTLTSVNTALNTLSYTGLPDYNGPDTLTVTTDDQGSSGTGGALADVDTVSITVDPVNDAPTAAGDAYSTDEDTALNVAAPGVLANDSDVDGGSINAVKVSDPAHGSVTLNGNGSFTYTPAANYNGADSFTYRAADGSLDSAIVTVDLTVNAVNDAPSNTRPGTQNAEEDTALTFSSGNGNQISTSDVDAGTDPVKVTLSALHGALTLSSTTGLSFGCTGCAGDGTSDSTMTFTGTIADVNARLNGLSYLNTLNYNGPEQITLTVNDQGSNGAGGAKQDADVVDVTVNPVNDAPVADAETFGGAGDLDDQAIGNTTLQVDDTNGAGNDNKSAPTSPHTEIQGDILDGDTDVDGAGPIVVQSAGSDAGATNGQTADGGTITIETDGDFVYQPPAAVSCDNGSDSFNYKISDQTNSGAGPIPGTAISTVTIHLEGCVWYVHNNSPGNAGTAMQPFDTLAQGETASGANHTVFVYDGDNTEVGYQTGFAMNSGERLIGEHEGLTVDPDGTGSMTADTVHPANAGAHPTLSGTNEDVVALDDGNEVRGFTLNPNGGSSGIAGASGDTLGGTIDDVNIVDTGTAGSDPALELDGTTGTFNLSNLAITNQAATSPASTSSGVRLNNAGTVNFVPAGAITVSRKGAPGLVASSTNLGTSTFDEITVNGSAAGGVALSNLLGTSSLALGDGTGTDLDLATTASPTAAFSAANVPNLAVGSAGTDNVSAGGGPAVDVSFTSTPAVNTQPTLSFDDVDSTSSTTDGINIDTIGTGTFSAVTGDIAGAAGIAVDLNGGSGDFAYLGTIANGEGSAVEITTRTGGLNTFAGPVTDTGDADGTAEDAGIRLNGNTGGSTTFSNLTKTFNTGEDNAVTMASSDGHTLSLTGGNLDIDTTTGKGLEATTSGILNVTGTGNTIDTGAGKSLNVTDTDVGSAAPLTFQRISGNGANAGITLSNTGANAALAVSGNGGTCTTASLAGCTGGVIQNTTGADSTSATPVGTGIALNNTRGVDLTRMHIHDHPNYGIRGTEVNGFSLADSVINGANGTTDGAFDDSSVFFDNSAGGAGLVGSASMLRTSITGGLTNQFWVSNDSGNLNRLTFDTVTVGSQNNQNDSIQVEGIGSSTTNVTVKNSTFTGTAGDHFQYIGNGSGGGDLNYESNAHTNNHPAIATGGGYITLTGGAAGPTTMNVHGNNTFRDGLTNAITMSKSHSYGSDSGSLNATVTGAQIGVSGVTNSGALEGSGIKFTHAGGSSSTNATVKITNNVIRQYNNYGINVQAGAGIASPGTLNATITGNTIAEPGNNAAISNIFQGIYFNNGVTPKNVNGDTAQGDSFQTCAHIASNNLSNSGRNGGHDLRILQRMNTTVRLPGYSGGSTDTTAVGNFLQSQNTLVSRSATVETSNTPSGGGFVGGAACPQ